jgi:hypothetical protein
MVLVSLIIQSYNESVDKLRIRYINLTTNQNYGMTLRLEKGFNNLSESAAHLYSAV